MIRSIEIKGLRGIREGKLDDLAPLTILVGPNGSGKSTVLDALYIAANPNPQGAVSQVAKRRTGVGQVTRWVFWRAEMGSDCCIRIGTDSVRLRECLLRAGGPTGPIVVKITQETKPTGVTGPAEGEASRAGRRTPTPGASMNPFRSNAPEPIDDVPSIRLVDAHLQLEKTPLHRLYTEAVEQGRGSVAREILAEVVRGTPDVQILTEGDAPILHLVFKDYSVPVALAGDGVQTLLRLSLVLASRRGGVVLMEEPEVHQHPGSIRQSARAILAAVRRDIQVVLTTHSLELIDALLVGEASDEDLERIAVYRVQLEDGVLKSSRLQGTEAAFALAQIDDDLR